MLSYIANIDTAQLIQKVCKRKNILILNTQESETDISQYVKETKVNFNLVKYLVIDLNSLTNSETEIIESIYNFSRIYTKTRIIIFASNYNEQNIILTNLYDLGFYNIINEFEVDQIENKLNIALSETGIQKNEAKRFKKQVEVIQKESKIKKLANKVKTNKKKENQKVKEASKTDMPTNLVYLFSLLLEMITRLVKFICYVLVFILTSIGLTILLNSELRELVFQIFGLK
jgi:superfamily II DNA helicase RecQ